MAIKLRNRLIENLGEVIWYSCRYGAKRQYQAATKSDQPRLGHSTDVRTHFQTWVWPARQKAREQKNAGQKNIAPTLLVYIFLPHIFLLSAARSHNVLQKITTLSATI
jgi:hypothetical protein